MTEKNETREWIANSVIMTLLEDQYNALKKLVADYGYVNRSVGDTSRSGTTRQFMFIVPRIGMDQDFQAVVEKMGATVQPETLSVDGVVQKGFLADPQYGVNLILSQMSRQVVKDARAVQQVMMVKAAQMQSQH